MGDFVGFRPSVLEGFSAEVTALALGPDAKALAVGLGDGSIWMCNPLSGEKQTELTGAGRRYPPWPFRRTENAWCPPPRTD